MNIGDAAQSALQPLRGPGGIAFLDDGRCSGWIQVANTQLGPANYWSTGGNGGVVRTIVAPGSLCDLASNVNGSGVAVITNLNNGNWNLLIQARPYFTIKQPAIATAWRTRVSTAVHYALSTSPGPSLISFAPLSGLPNLYRTP